MGIRHCVCDVLFIGLPLIILDICAKLFENPTRGSKDIERTRKCDGRTDGRTDRQTDNGAKNNMSPHFMGET